MSQKKIRSFDFTDSDKWTSADDGLIVDDLLTLTDPVLDRPWTVRKWDAVPAFDDDGNCKLANGVEYISIVDAGGQLLDLGDYCFVFRLKLSGDNGTHFRTLHHYQSEVGNAHIRNAIYRTATANIRVWTHRTNNYKQSDYYLNAVTSYGDPLWIDGNFKKVIISFRGNRLRFYIDGIAVCETCGLDLDDTDGGSVGFSSLYGTLKWKVGGGSAGGSSTPHPYISEKRSGSAALSTAGRWTLPIDFESFDKLCWAYDNIHDTDKEQIDQVTISVRIYNSGAWGDWVELDSTGDMSGFSALPLDKVDVKVALNNSADVNEPFTSYPAVESLSIIYNGWSPMPPDIFIDSAMGVLETLLTNNEPLAAITGYEGAKICQRGNWYPQLQGKAIIYICAITSTPIEMGQSTQHDQAWDWEHHIYIFPTTSEQQTDLRTSLMREDTGLYRFSKAVFDALKLMDLGSLFRFSDIDDVIFDPNEVQGPHDNMSMIQITARSTAEAR